MKIRRAAALIAACGVAAACVQANVLEESAGALEPSPTWSTTSGENGDLRLTAGLAAESPTQTLATIRLTGAPAGATYAWQVHYGSCGNDVGVIGDMNAYPAITVDAEGVATGRAMLPFTVPSRRSGSFFVKVHDPADWSKVVACGDLVARGVRAADY